MVLALIKVPVNINHNNHWTSEYACTWGSCVISLLSPGRKNMSYLPCEDPQHTQIRHAAHFEHQKDSPCAFGHLAPSNPTAPPLVRICIRCASGSFCIFEQHPKNALNPQDSCRDLRSLSLCLAPHPAFCIMTQGRVLNDALLAGNQASGALIRREIEKPYSFCITDGTAPPMHPIPGLRLRNLN